MSSSQIQSESVVAEPIESGSRIGYRRNGSRGWTEGKRKESFRQSACLHSVLNRHAQAMEMQNPARQIEERQKKNGPKRSPEECFGPSNRYLGQLEKSLRVLPCSSRPGVCLYFSPTSSTGVSAGAAPDSGMLKSWPEPEPVPPRSSRCGLALPSLSSGSGSGPP